MVLVDTSVWFLALRRRSADLSPEQERLRLELSELIREGRAQPFGPIRQELLSGIREESQYRRLREHLCAFDDVKLSTGDYERAAALSNHCRTQGVSGSPTDFLICAVAIRLQWPVLTMDSDFRVYARHIPIKLFEHRSY
jgi:predicted nucleic acid-binding protein